MKKQFKFFAILLFSVTFGITYAQLPDGSIAPDFTVTDINGNSYRLYELLDSGYTVIIDFSATWCGPCWSYHESGDLETLWDEHGPAGATGVSVNTTDDIFVMMIESSSNTNLADIQGTGGNTQGDWTAGTNFPIVNDDNVSNLYEVTYFPTVYTVCPNKLLTETGAYSATYHYQLASECSPIVEGINVAILSTVSSLYSGCSNTASGSIEVTIQNSGTDNSSLGIISIAVVADGDTLAVEDYNASNLAQFATDEITFNNLQTDAESYSIVITTVDNNLADNLASGTIEYSNNETNQFVTVKLLTDAYGGETYVEIKDENDNVIWFEGNEEIAGNYNTEQLTPPTDPTNPLSNNTEYSWQVDLPSTGCFSFTIGDYYGDGLNSSIYTDGGPDGNWSVDDNNGVVITQIAEPNFGGSDETVFNNNSLGDSTISIDKNQNVASLSLYPNPVNSVGELRFNLTQASSVGLEVVDLLGKVMLSKNVSLNAGQQNIRFDVANLPNGVYLAKLSVNDKVSVEKFTIMK